MKKCGEISIKFPTFFLLTCYYTQINFATSFGSNIISCELLSPIDLNAMRRINQDSAFPMVVAVPQSEWNDIKDMLIEVKEILQTDMQEVKGMWLESQQARKMLGVSQKTWQNYRDQGLIPFSQYGRKIMVKRTDIENFLNQHKVYGRKV